jgi:perosamine synthetase
MKSSYITYKKAVEKNFNFLKSSKTIQECYLRAIKIPDGGFLLPVGLVHQSDIHLLQQLTNWRNQNVAVYPTQFVATIESTRAWLRDRLLDVPDRMLFLVTSDVGLVLGHLGFNACYNENYEFEIDNVVRGIRGNDPGIFKRAVSTIISWAVKTINVNGFFLRVMDDNAHAIKFYEGSDFVQTTRISLTKETIEGTTVFRESKLGDVRVKDFIRMDYRPKIAVGSSMILTAGPSISAREGVYAFDAALNGWNQQWSKYLTAFEQKFSDYIGTRYAIATSSCTGALQIALMALDIGPGDEVIVPDETWVATANAVRYVGAVPVFADVELDSWTLSAESVESLITSNTRALIPVHMYGHPAKMDSILQVARRHDLKVIEDAAPAIGAEWMGRRCGTFSHFSAFSFQGAKLLVTGEGGMLVTDDEELYKKALKIWDQGRNPSKIFWIDDHGVKFKMSNIQAAIGLAQLERADELIEMKRRLFAWYEEGLASIDCISLNKEVKGARSIYWMSSIRMHDDAPLSRDHLIKRLKERNIDTRPVFPAISQYPIWPREQPPQPIASLLGKQALNLPSGVCLTKSEVMYVCETLRDLLR